MNPPIDSSVKSVKRALDVLEFLADERDPPSFLDVMRRLDIPRSSLFHLMGELMKRGYVEQTSAGSRYRPGPMVAVIATSAARRSWLVQTVRPVIRKLSDQTNEFSVFYVVEGDMVRGLAVEDGNHALSYRIAPDHLLPLHAFAAGKVALADRTPIALETYLSTVERQKFTPNTITDADALRKIVDRVRREGVGRSLSEYALGVMGIAMPVHSGGQLIGIINVSIPEPRASAKQQALVIDRLREAVENLTAQLKPDRLDRDPPKRTKAVKSRLNPPRAQRS